MLACVIPSSGGRNEAMIQTMMHGIKLLDDNWLTLDLRVGDEWSDEDLFPAEQREVREMAQYLRDIKKHGGDHRGAQGQDVRVHGEEQHQEHPVGYVQHHDGTGRHDIEV